jgi:hypothetical protein
MRRPDTAPTDTAPNGDALTRIHREIAVYYAELAPEQFRVPALDGFAEEWARAAGATIAVTSTWRRCPPSVPFWERRMGYEERSVNLRWRL